MSILEQFWILFRSNSDDVKKGADEAKKHTDTLNNSLKDTDDKSLKIGEKFVEMGRGLAGVVAAGLSIHAVIDDLKSALEYTTRLDFASRALAVDVSSLDAWGNAIRRTGGSATGFESSVKSLAQHLGSSTQIAIKVLPLLADSFRKLGQTRALRYGAMLGLDESTILLLQKGRREVDALLARQKELGLVTKADVEITRKFNEQMEDTGHAFRIAFVESLDTILPLLTKLMAGIEVVGLFFQRHSNLIVGSLIGIAGAATIAAFAFGLLTSPITLTILAVAALIAVFALLYDDIVNFINGNDSLIGLLIPSWKAFGDFFTALFRGIKATIEAVLHPLEAFHKATEKLRSLNLTKGPGNIALGQFGKNNSVASTSAEQSVTVGTSEINVIQKPLDPITLGQQALLLARDTPLAAQSSNSIINAQNRSRSNTVTTGPITINTEATDADGIADSLSGALEKHFWHANSQFDDGVVA